jgi:hypothetical protein
MKTWNDINVKEFLSLDDFFTLFDKLPLNEEEKTEICQFYYPMYQKFIECEVKTEDAWIAVRNIFAFKNQQIVERIKVL